MQIHGLEHSMILGEVNIQIKKKAEMAVCIPDKSNRLVLHLNSAPRAETLGYTEIKTCTRLIARQKLQTQPGDPLPPSQS